MIFVWVNSQTRSKKHPREPNYYNKACIFQKFFKYLSLFPKNCIRKVETDRCRCWKTDAFLKPWSWNYMSFLLANLLLVNMRWLHFIQGPSIQEWFFLFAQTIQLQTSWDELSTHQAEADSLNLVILLLSFKLLLDFYHLHQQFWGV